EHPSHGLQANPCRAVDHRFIKRVTRPMLGFKVFHFAAANLVGIETAHLIRKRQIGQSDVSPFKQFADLAA
ncbi:MAG: hypothetical protein ACPGGK_12315, partial [Pikeienuella sp.]